MIGGKGQRGFTYLTALLFVAVSGFGLAAVSEAWSHFRQREKETELLWIGNQFRQAIGLYYHRGAGGVNRYPQKLEDLLEDRRFPNPQRYLRRIYADPMTGKAEWGTISAPEGGIMGVYSMSKKKPLKTGQSGSSYGEWQFVYEPPKAPTGRPASKR